MTDTLRWLAEDVEHARLRPPTLDGSFAVITRGDDGAYIPTFGAFAKEEIASLRSELSVPNGWILETLYYDLGPTVSPTGQNLEGYRAAVHGTRVLARLKEPHASGKPLQIYTLNGGELVVPPGGTVPLYACLTRVTPDGHIAAVVGSPGPDSYLWKDGNRPLLQYILLTLSLRIHYQGSSVFAERRWHPDLVRTMESIGGLEVSKDPKEVNRARQDFALFDDLGKLRPKGGSPKGPRKGQVWSRRQCLEWWLAWELDREPTQLDLAGDMDVSDPETAVARWRTTGLYWPPTQAELNEIGDIE